ncbi:MAG TPA: radical SAM protein [Planctomycetota bacterium]|nr:radical SAM protein [Planctomycetota bacterium]
MIFAPTDSQKVFLHSERLAAWLRDGRSFPVTIELDATNRCNHACSFCCWSVLHDRRRDTMSWDFMAKVLDDLASVGVKAVIWTGGGEPLVNPHTAAGMERAQAAGMRNALFTNGALLTEQLARRLVVSCDWIRFSMAAGTRSEYQRIQGVDDFDLVRRNVAMIVELARREGSPIRLGAMMLLHKTSLETFLPFVESCRDLGLSFAQGKPSNNYDHESRSGFILERNVNLRLRAGEVDAQPDLLTNEFDPEWWANEAAPLLRAAGELARPGFAVVTSQYVETKYGDAPPPENGHHDCDVNNFATAITASGDVVWCKNYRDRPEYVIGNLHEQTMAEIWAGERRRAVQAGIDDRRCARFCQNKKLAHLLRTLRHPDPALNPDFL